MKSYVIEWKSLVNGRTGRGTKVFELEEAHRLASELNREYPGIHHEVVEGNGSAKAPSKPVEPVPAKEVEAPAEVPELNHSHDHAFSFK